MSGTSVFMVRDLGILRPTDETGQELINRISQGQVVEVTVRQPRNLQHHRLFWALMTVVHRNVDQSEYPTRENLVNHIKYKTGHCEVFYAKDGATLFTPKSISFAAMDQTEFSAFYDLVCDYVVKEILPGVSKESLDDEVQIELMTGIKIREDRYT